MKQCTHHAKWYNCDICCRQLNNQPLKPKEVENLLKQSMIAFAISAILGYIVPAPYGSFSIFAVAIAFLIYGWKNRKESAQNSGLKYQNGKGEE